jgi:hypothetical protein
MSQTTTARRSQLSIVSEPKTEAPIETVNPVTLDSAKLIDLWELRILNDAAFVFLALQHDRANDRGFDLDSFVFRWRGITNPDKELRRSGVMRVLETLEKNELLAIDRVNVQLNLLEM